MTRCSDVCSGSSCPSDPLFYATRCNSLCLKNENVCNSNGELVSSQSDSSDCMNCLESSNPSSCQEQQQCKAGEYCPDFYIGFCKKCIYNIFIAWMQCVGITNVQRLTNCVVDSVSYGHCKSCVCWAACKFGLRNVCNCCKHGQCSQSRIDPDMQSMVASGRNGEK